MYIYAHAYYTNNIFPSNCCSSSRNVFSIRRRTTTAKTTIVARRSKYTRVRNRIYYNDDSTIIIIFNIVNSDLLNQRTTRCIMMKHFLGDKISLRSEKRRRFVIDIVICYLYLFSTIAAVAYTAAATVMGRTYKHTSHKPIGKYRSNNIIYM